MKDHIRRLIDEQTGSYCDFVAADVASHLGHNPSGVIFEEGPDLTGQLAVGRNTHQHGHPRPFP